MTRPRARRPVSPAEEEHWASLWNDGSGLSMLAIARITGRSASVLQYRLSPQRRQKALDAQWCLDHARRPKRKHHLSRRQNGNR